MSSTPASAAKETPTHIYFYAHTGTSPYTIFSQHHPTPFTDPPPSLFNPTSSNNSPRYFHTAEHYMMFQKALLMHDTASALAILSASTPAEAKALGRGVRDFDPVRWERECEDIVTRGNWLKFAQDEGAKAVLLGTGEKVLVEASEGDRIWGVGFGVEEAEGRKGEWGRNLLGRCLMAVRRMLREEDEGVGRWG